MTLGKFKFNIYIELTALTPMLDNPTFMTDS